MKHSHLLVALLSIFSGLVIGTTPVMAATAEWLVDGTQVESALSADVEGGLELTDLKVPLFGETTVLCEGISDGTIGPSNKGEITELLSLSGKVNEIICSGVKGACGTSAEAAIVKPVGLPWKGEIEMMTGGIFLGVANTSNEPGFDIVCKSSGLLDECKAGPTVAQTGILTNEANDVRVVVNLREEEENKELGTCTQGGVESSHLQGEGMLFLTGAEVGLTLQVS